MAEDAAGASTVAWGGKADAWTTALGTGAGAAAGSGSGWAAGKEVMTEAKERMAKG